MGFPTKPFSSILSILLFYPHPWTVERANGMFSLPEHGSDGGFFLLKGSFPPLCWQVLVCRGLGNHLGSFSNIAGSVFFIFPHDVCHCRWYSTPDQYRPLTHLLYLQWAWKLTSLTNFTIFSFLRCSIFFWPFVYVYCHTVVRDDEELECSWFTHSSHPSVKVSACHWWCMSSYLQNDLFSSVTSALGN